eukprot:COSAG02_NODE_31734_length_528_cov_0.972028_1_plen_75_part_10
MVALCAQIEMPPADKVAFLYQVEDAELPTQFLKAYPRKHKLVAKDEFVPFGFEVGGALGAKVEWFLAECVRVVEW